MKFEHLFSPMQVGKVTYRNRIVSAPMAFGLIVQNPDARDFTYRKLEASAKGGNGRRQLHRRRPYPRLPSL